MTFGSVAAAFPAAVAAYSEALATLGETAGTLVPVRRPPHQPETGRIGKLIEERGGVDAEIGARIERILLYSRVELALIALIAMDMVLKPGL